MKVFFSKTDLIHERSKTYKSIGLVPTMGNLHQGHISLLQESIAENEISVLSIFVNPLQFGANEDLENYPKTLEEDLQKIKDVIPRNSEGSEQKEVWVLAPTIDDFYPNGFNTSVIVNENKNMLCGLDRPTHFDGVTTVVFKLFNIVKPTRAYFGKKDYQQLWLIKKMNDDLELGIEIIGMPIVREQSGLAMSSRNRYLKTHEQSSALELNQTLQSLIAEIKKKGRFDAEIAALLEKLKIKQDLIYLSVRNPDTLNISKNTDKDFVILGAKRVGETRLIDNVEFSL